MTSLWLRLLLCTGLLWTATASLPKPMSNATYLIAVSKTIRADSVMRMCLQLKGATHPVNMRVELMDYEGRRVQPGQSYYLNPTDGIKRIQFKFAKYLRKPQYYMYFLRVIASGGVNFNEFVPLRWRNRQISVLLQMDRIHYKAGQTVRFRALGMLPDNKVPDEPMDLVITDPLNNRVAYFSRKKGEKSRVLSGELQLPEEPRIGVYTIRARMKGGSNKKHFTVFDYDTPNFEVLIWAPKVDVRDTKVKVKVVARYLIGSPIEGSGTLRIEAAYTHLHGQKPHILEKKFQIDKRGFGVVHINMTEIRDVLCKSNYHYRYHCTHSHSLYYVAYRAIRFTATVKDHNSFQIVKRKKDIYLTAYKSYLRFINTEYRFKPGLPHMFTVQDTRSDGNPVRKLRYGKTLNITIKYRVKHPNRTSCYWWYYSSYKSLLNQTVTIDEETKQATFKIPKIPDDACYIRVYGTDGKRYFYRFMYPYYSASRTYLYIEHNKPFDAGKVRRLTVMSNKPFKKFSCLIYARGVLVAHEEMTKPREIMNTSFQFSVTKDYAPVVHIIIYTVTKAGEVVADGLTLPVDYQPYPVVLKLNGQKNKPIGPGKEVSLSVDALKGAEVFVFGRDNRVLTRYNDLKPEDVVKAKMAHDVSVRYFPYEYRVSDLFRNAGVGLISNLKNVRSFYYYYYYYYYSYRVPRHYQYHRYWYSRYYRSYYYSCHRYFPLPGPPGKMVYFHNRPLDYPEMYLPDTWIWTSEKVGKKKNVLTYTAPDTITNVTISAFAVHQRRGLSLAKDPAELGTIKSLFATMFLLETAVRGEVVCFNAIAHNFDSKNHSVVMKLERSDKFDVLRLVKSGSTYTESYAYAYEKKDLGTIGPGHMKSAMFCLKFKKIGDVKVRITIDSDAAWDDLEKTIKIKSEGMPRTKTYPALVELTSSSSKFSTSFDIDVPTDVVANSYRVSVAVSSDPLGTSVENLGHLLKMPHGSGAQNMISMAPNIYILNYLKATSRIANYQAMARRIMQAGYHQQMVFQRYDGSFSGFGNWDKHGSTWLSAFVLKVFTQASAFGTPYGLHVEPDMVARVIGFVTEQQNADGSFREMGRPLYARLQGKSSQSALRLAAFTTISLLESKMFVKSYKLHVAAFRASYAGGKATAYMVKRLSKLGANDAYSSCIVAYALSLVGSKNASQAIALMTSAATTVGGVYRYWAGSSMEEQIEMSSYGLLAYMKKNMEAEAKMVYRWLSKHKGPYGGYHSTQDTVLALQALATMTSLAPKKTFSDIDVKVRVARAIQSQFSRVADVKIKSSDKELVLPRRPNLNWPSEHTPGKIIVNASSTVPSGKSVYAMAQVTVDYNVKRVPASGGLKAVVKIMNETTFSFIMNTCLYRLATVDLEPYYVAEFMIPTAYKLDRKQSKFGFAKKVRYTKNKVIMYIAATQLPSCSSLMMTMDKGRVAYVSPPMVRFYNPFNHKEEVIEGCLLKQYKICAVTPEQCP